MFSVILNGMDDDRRRSLHDVLTKSDSRFRASDLMRLDNQRYFHFVGGSVIPFWTGENVAISEVNKAIRDRVGVIDTVTYGISVPAVDGRGGMAAIVINDDYQAEWARRLPGGPPADLPALVRDPL